MTSVEIWKDIDGYKGLYQISNMGRVRSIYRYKKVLKPLGGVYKQVQLCKNKHVKAHLIHRLVASAFVPNIELKPCVNHIDGDKLNNCADNLEWMTYSENEIHSYKVLGKKANCNRLGLYGSNCYNHRCINQLSMSGHIIRQFESRGEASRATGISSGNIWLAMNGKRSHAGGFKWSYK